MSVATWYTIVGNSDYYWRVLAPAEAVGGSACLIPEKGGFYALTQPNTDTPFRWTQDGSGMTSYPDHQGVAVWTRPDGPRALHALAMKRLHGVFQVGETDDNYLAPVQQNVYMRANRFDVNHRSQHLKAMLSMDRLVFSTARLRDQYHHGLRAEFGRQLPEMVVCRNHVFRSDWPEREKHDGPVRVGWMGSPSHVWDVKLAWPALLYAARNGAQTYMVGYDPASEEEHRITSAKGRRDQAEWRKVGYTFIPWRRLDGTKRMSLPLDIGLCPLETNQFTLGKSDVKAIEYTIAGAAVVAQNNEVYNRDWVHGETCLLAGSPSEMIDAVALLMRDVKLRNRLVANAQEYVRENRCEKQLREEWGAAVAC